MSRLRMTESLSAWEELRRQACQLENEIDLKLVSFSKLGTNYSTFGEYRMVHSEPLTLPNKASAAQLFDNMALDIEQLLAKLTQVNEKLSEFTRVPAGGTLSNATSMHTLQRHWDILQDYSHEFWKIRTNISNFREREELLDTAHRDSSYKNSSSTDLYLKEHEHLLSSERLVDEQISIAMATRENLQSQKSALHLVSDKLSALANRFPVVNSLIQRINLRKRRDAIIIASVIAVCLILILLYAFSK